MMRTRTPKALKILLFIVIFALLFIVIFAAFIFLCSLCLYFFEKDNQPNAFDSIGSAMQYVLIAMTTIGYGDATPLTSGGKAVVFLSSSIGILAAIAFWIWMAFIVFGRVISGKYFRKKLGGHTRKLEV